MYSYLTCERCGEEYYCNSYDVTHWVEINGRQIDCDETLFCDLCYEYYISDDEHLDCEYLTLLELRKSQEELVEEVKELKALVEEVKKDLTRLDKSK